MSSVEILCGLTYMQIVDIAIECPNKRAAAKRLGVSERQFYAVIKRRGMGHWFRCEKPRPRCISREDIVELAGQGFIRADVADLLGISEGYLKDLVHEWNLQDAFTVRRGKAAWVARRGYCV
jgi:transposase